MSCYCLENTKTHPADYIYTIPGSGLTAGVPLCDEWYQLTHGFLPLIISSCVSVLIVVANFLVRLVFLNIADCIGFKNASDRANFIVKGVFITSFFQTGILPLLAGVDVRGVPVLSSLFQGIYTDFNPYWFGDIGYII